MRRNVRRLNREVGGVVVAISGGKATATTKKFGEDVSGVVKKAANLSELKRYCKAAEEAAREVLVESQAAEASFGATYEAGGSSATSDVQSLANIDDSLPLKSPSRMVALQLANGNPLFREKLKKKLEDSGVTFEMDEATGVLGTLGANTANNRKPAKKLPLSSSTGVENDDKSKPAKMRQKRKAGGDNSSIMRRRRKQDIEIAITGTAAQIHPGGPMMVGGTPFRSLGFGYGPTGQPGTVSPLNVDKHVNFGDDLYSAGALGSLGNLMGLPIGDTPAKGFLSDGGSSSSGQKDLNGSTPRFDFDEVVQGFPSPRGSAGGAVGSSPSRWSMGSSGSASIFVFPDSKGKEQGRHSMSGEPPLPPSVNKEGGSGDEPRSSSNAGSLTKRPRRMSGGRPGETPSPSALTLPSPMSALPSPSFADISASFLSNDSLEHTVVKSVPESYKKPPRHSLEGGVLEPAVVSGSDGNCSDSGRSSESSHGSANSSVSN